MEKEVVYTDKYALILSDDEIKVGDWYLRYQTIMRCIKFELSFNEATNKNETIIFSDSCGDPYERSREWHKKIIAHLPLSDAPILEGVTLLPSFSWGQQDDVEELAEREYPTFNLGLNATTSVHTISQEAFIIGYNKAKEKYKYTEEDMINFAIWYYKTQGLSESNIKYWGKDLFQVWKSLQQPSRPTHFECEMKNCDKCVYVQGGNLSPDCCNQLKPKTTTNSQGHIELVGKYI